VVSTAAHLAAIDGSRKSSMMPVGFNADISQTPEAEIVALVSFGLLSCVATCAGVSEECGIGASAVAVGALLTCAPLVVMARNTATIPTITSYCFPIFDNLAFLRSKV
jgi:hypothetical protein